MGETFCCLRPWLEMVRLVSSGTEATMTALRLARGHTGRSLIVKFEGCYHGHADAPLGKAAAGLPASIARAMHASRRGADPGRSDDGVPRRARRRAGTLRHPARPHHAR